jgi:polysaccharide export outer membrane protein
MRSFQSCRTLFLPIAIFLAFTASSRSVSAQEPKAEAKATQEYRLGVGDQLQLSVWQQPDLDRELRIRDDGTIVVPLVGEVQAAGLTVPDLERQLAKQLRSFNRDITEVSVTVSSYQSFQVFVMGAVARPGAHSFRKPPNVWDAIRTAGGPTATANLHRVRVIHNDQGSTVTTIVNVANVVQGEGEGDIPELSPGDTVIVPDNTVTGTSSDWKTGVQVLGDVPRAGFYTVDGPTPVLTVILQAGGFGASGDPRRVRVVHDPGRGPLQGRAVDTTLFLENGQASGNPLVYSGDTVYVERRPAGSFWRFVPGIIASLTGITALIVSLSGR